MSCCGCADDEENEQQADNGVRSCTDIFWLLLYIVFWSLMLLIAAFSFVYGNPIRIINGYDSFGNTCGTRYNKKLANLELSGIDTSNRPYLLFYDIQNLRQSLKICVQQCPKENLNTVDDIYSYYKNSKQEVCKYGFDYNDFKNPQITNKLGLSGTFGPCPIVPVYASAPVLNRCVPKPLNDLTKGVLSDFYGLLNSWDTLEQILRDVFNTWHHIIALTFLAFLLSLFTISILHLLAALVSYIIMILVSVASVAGTAFLWYTYVDIKRNLDKTNEDTLLLESVRNETAFFWYSIVATVITCIILLLVIVMRKKVDFLADLFRETSKCVASLPGLILQPLVTFAWLLGFFAFWVFVILCLATSYYPGTSGVESGAGTTGLRSPDTKGSFLEQFENFSISNVNKMTIVEYIDPSWVKYMWWVYFIGLIWTSEFIMGCQAMVISGSVAHWYYRHKYKSNDHIIYSICKLIKYHLGSVAKGSLLITVFKIPRLLMMYLQQRLKRGKEGGSVCADGCLKCCICCFYCLEKFIRYLNQNAYTVIAIDGVHFCKAAKTAFEVLASHSLEVATINSIGDFILFLGKCFVTATTGCVGLYLFRMNSKLTFYAAPTLIVCIFAFFVAHCILSLYEMVLDTVYLCQCQNDADPSDAMHMQRIQQVQQETNGNAAITAGDGDATDDVPN